MRRCVAPQAQKEGNAGQKHAGGVGGGDGGDLVSADGDQVFGRHGTQPGGQLGGAIGGEFIGVHLDAEAHGGGPSQVVFSLRVREIALLAKNIDKLGQALLPHLRQYGFQQMLEVVAVAVAELVGNFMGAHEGGDNVHGMAPGKRLQRPQLLYFGLLVQAVAALGLHGGGAAQQHPVQALAAGFNQLVEGHFPSAAHRVVDATAAGGDFLVTYPLQLLLELVLARAGERQMRMGVDQSRQGDLAARIQFQPAGLQVALRKSFGLGTNELDLSLPGPDAHIGLDAQAICLAAACHAVGSRIDQLADITDKGVGGNHFFLIGFKRWKVGTSSGSSKLSGPWVILGMLPSLT